MKISEIVLLERPFTVGKANGKIACIAKGTIEDITQFHKSVDEIEVHYKNKKVKSMKRGYSIFQPSNFARQE